MEKRYFEIVRNGRICTLWLNRPETKNAFHPDLINGLIGTLLELSADTTLSVLIFRGKNGNFSSGADLNWMRESGSGTIEGNIADGRLIQKLMEALDQLPIPLISVTSGAVYGGALGILGCSDWVLSTGDSSFAFAEVRLGLAPAVIMPFIMNRASSMRIKQLMLTGAAFNADQARQAGLTDFVGNPEETESELAKLTASLSSLPTGAVREIKGLWKAARPAFPENLAETTVSSLARLKGTPEAQDLLSNFLNRKR